MKTIGLELAEEGFELSLAEVLGQERNQSILIVYFE